MQNVTRSCIEEGYLGEGFPVWNHLLGFVSHVLLSFVPSANFIVYCLVGNKFRQIPNLLLILAYLPQPRLKTYLNICQNLIKSEIFRGFYPLGINMSILQLQDLSDVFDNQQKMLADMSSWLTSNLNFCQEPFRGQLKLHYFFYLKSLKGHSGVIEAF